MKIERKDKVVTITFDSDWSAENIVHAMKRHQWVKFSGDGEICNLKEEPTETDLDNILQSTTYNLFSENSKIKHIPDTVNKANDEYNTNSIYIQHIYGYDGDYQRKAKLLLNCGFEVLRSINKPFTYKEFVNGKSVEKTEMRHYEIWWLPYVSFATGELKGKTQKEILKWIWQVISPGNVDISGEKWALSCE